MKTGVQWLIVGLIVLLAGNQYYNQKLIQTQISNQDVKLQVLSDSYAEGQGGLEKKMTVAIESYIATKKKDKVKSKYSSYSKAVKDVPKGKHIYGSLDASFTLIEFSDLECPYCKRFHKTPKKIVDLSGGKMNWQWKHMPLSGHNPSALIQAEASECVADIAGNKAFWVFFSSIIIEMLRSEAPCAIALILILFAPRLLNNFPLIP